MQKEHISRELLKITHSELTSIVPLRFTEFIRSHATYHDYDDEILTMPIGTSS